MKHMRMIGNYIENLCKQNNVSARELANLLKCPENKIYSLFKGLAYLSIPQIQKIADLCNVTVDDILKGDEELYRQTFTKEKHSEKILDIIEDYIDIEKAILRNNKITLK